MPGKDPPRFDLGPEPASDRGFIARARRHQSRFRAETLGIEDYREQGSRLPTAHALAGKNFYREWPGLLDLVHERYGRKDTRVYYDMLCSQHLPFNLFGPLALLPKGPLARKLCMWIAPELENVDEIRIEYAPPEAARVLDDKTSFDVYIRGGKVVLGVEVKYTEKPYSYGPKERARMIAEDSEYHRASARAGIYKAGAIEQLRRPALKQLWRNHLLGTCINEAEFRSVVLYPSENEHARRAVVAYSELLLPQHRHTFVPITFEQWVAAARRATVDRNELDWLSYLCARYDLPEQLPDASLLRIPELIFPIELCVPDGEEARYPACAAAARRDWAAMARVTTMDDMLHLAYAMNDGYRVSARLGFGHCGDLENAHTARFRETGRYVGLASELWCCLFFMARAWAWTDYPGRAADEGIEDWNALYAALVEQLQCGDGSVLPGPDGMTVWRGRGGLPASEPEEQLGSTYARRS